MRVRAKWVEGVAFVGESGSGHAVVMDGAPEAGGRNLGPRPMEMVLLGLAGCTGFDVVTILRKARQAVTDCVVEVEAERAETVPRVFTRIHVHYRVRGRGLDARAVARAVQLSAEKYCSVSRMLAASVEIRHDHRVEEEAGDGAGGP
ncbi:OsmC family protein [Inmirania thermothiophila]|uniref:Putative redox protein n=1 Tax=Inmirania thermothiophila TaxID=1750597 RepID=A0A3N1XWK1_9GAMM|nr:OsmC family protein [Inmirania thermothiophila]ROR29572.1 putative redox protein [Inmirania thermothiophila]